MTARTPRATDPASAQLAPVMEVFASIQGEGAYVGEPQVFLRLAGCPLRCKYCDTPGSWDVARRARVAALDGVRSEESFASPFQAACWIREVEDGEPRTVSVTGGEPLLWPDFLIGLERVAGDRRLHLETAGAHPEALALVIDRFDHVSLDLKAASDLDDPVELVPELPQERRGDLLPRAPERPPRTAEDWRRTRARSLALVKGRDAAAKIVVCGETSPEEYEALCDEVAEHAPDCLVVVQPVTPLRGVAPADDVLLYEVAEYARSLKLAVRVLPQVHKLLRIP